MFLEMLQRNDQRQFVALERVEIGITTQLLDNGTVFYKGYLLLKIILPIKELLLVKNVK